jgi:molybdate transport system substrate-binding protein
VKLALNVGWAKRSVPTNRITVRKFGAWARRLRAFAHPTILAFSLTAQPSLAAEVRVYTSGAPAPVVQIVAALSSANMARDHVWVTVGTVAEIQRMLTTTQPPDAVILPGPVIDALDKTGALSPGSRIELARVGIGVAVRAGAPLPDISTEDAVRRMLVAARSIVHSDPAGGGFAGAQIARMMARLGIAELVGPKTVYKFAILGGTAAVANSDAEIGLFNVSEILADKGVTLVGPLPPSLQSYIAFAGAVPAGSASPDAALAFLRSLAAPDARGAWTAAGFEPR